MTTTNTDRIFSPSVSHSEGNLENKLRPQSFSEFPGQDSVKQKLKIFTAAAKKRKLPLDHTLFCGPPGLGKTSLAYILASELGVGITTTSGPALYRKGDLAAILASLKPGNVLFIDEIHRLSRDVEEYLYTAMEDFFIDIFTGEGLGARPVRLPVAKFTLLGATTRPGLLKGPFRNRFGIVEHLTFYTPESLAQILCRSAQVLGVKITDDGVGELAKRSRGTPRIANRLLKRVRDYAEVTADGLVDGNLARHALMQLGVDERGLDEVDRRILNLIHEKFQGGPVGASTLAAALNEELDTLEEVYEPYLVQEGILQKTPRGRVLTSRALEFLGQALKGK